MSYVKSVLKDSGNDLQVVGKIRNILEKRIKIFPLETPKFFWMVGLSFILFFGSAIFRNYVDTAFLKRYGTDTIPTMLIINAVFTIFIFGAMDRILSKYSDILVIGIFVAFFSVAGGACFIVTKADISIVYPILYQLCLVLVMAILGFERYYKWRRPSLIHTLT